MSPNIPGTDIGCRMGDHHIFYSYPKLFSDNLSDYRLGSLSHICCTGEDVDGPKVIHFDDCSTTIRFINSGASSNMDKGSHPNSSSIFSPSNLSPIQSLCND